MSRLRSIIGIILVAVIIAFFLGATAYTDWLWFVSLGYQKIFLTSWTYRIAVGLVFGLAAFTVLALNVALAKRLSPNIHFVARRLEFEQFLRQARFYIDHYFSLLAYLGSAVLALLVGISMGAGWETWLRYFSHAPSGVKDPLLGRDVSFYLFTLPVIEIVNRFLLLILFAALIAAAFVHLIRGTFSFGRGFTAMFNQGRIHLSLLAGLLLLVFTARWWLAQYQLLYSPRGAVFGAGYTDVHVLLPAYKILVGAGLFTALLIIVYGLTNRWSWPLAGLAVTAGIWVVGVGLLPTVVQQYRVAPNEIAKERPYIANSIEFTRRAFGLDKVERRRFSAAEKPSAKAVAENQSTIDSLRLWDWRPLKKTYGQIQEIRLYYKFGDVDLDRYTVNGRYRQIALSARELASDRLPESARTWVNRHLVYTHGYGLVASPVNEVAGEGLPELIIKNIPPQSSTDLKVERPEIYFGEMTDDYAVVKTKTREFDYPAGDANKYTSYKGRDGVSLGNYLNKLAFAYRFGTAKLLLSDSVGPNSRVLFHRNVKERLQVIAPFLAYDPDPYLVISKGRLYWIVDAYTMTDRYPYSKPAAAGLNYIRNPVKAVIDAYNGTVDFYLTGDRDPIIAAYDRAYPGVFKPLSELDPDLLAHLRYPEALFKAQAEVYATFHMGDPQVFYNKEDLWGLPNEIYDNQTTAMDPYYAVMRLPGEKRPEFALISPFTPINKSNMIAWLAARSDRPNYGKLVLYTFPKDKLIFGPMQIEARLDQDPEISRQLSLWNQRGSRVIRGNLLVVPIGDSILYVEPIYLQAEASELPELKRVAAGIGDKVVMEPTLEAALGRLLGAAPPAAPEGARPPEAGGEGRREAAPTAPGEPARREQLIQRAADAFEKAEEAQRAGDWAEYGRRMKTLKDALEQLSQD